MDWRLKSIISTKITRLSPHMFRWRQTIPFVERTSCMYSVWLQPQYFQWWVKYALLLWNTMIFQNFHSLSDICLFYSLWNILERLIFSHRVEMTATSLLIQIRGEPEPIVNVWIILCNRFSLLFFSGKISSPYSIGWIPMVLRFLNVFVLFVSFLTEFVLESDTQRIVLELYKPKESVWWPSLIVGDAEIDVDLIEGSKYLDDSLLKKVKVRRL